MQSWDSICTQIAATTNRQFTASNVRVIGGGCINRAYQISDDTRHYFVKCNTPGNLAMFEAEAAGLNEIMQSHTIRVPQPICHGQDRHASWLVLEYIVMANGGHGSAAALGKQLAAMHRTVATNYGWFRSNTIGETAQHNQNSSNWVDFWRDRRLRYQLDLASEHGYGGKLQTLGEQLLIHLEHFFSDTPPSPSLLHGDLWGGNYAYDEAGDPVIFDPAVYYGDREADIAMTELFGGFSPDFYSAYRCDYPLDSGYNTRKVIYNLYHILNHLNLFGSSYRHQAEQTMSWLLAEIR